MIVLVSEVTLPSIPLWSVKRNLFVTGYVSIRNISEEISPCLVPCYVLAHLSYGGMRVLYSRPVGGSKKHAWALLFSRVHLRKVRCAVSP